MLQADTKVKHVCINLLYCCLLRRKKAHKGLNLLFLIIECVAEVKAKHIKNTSGGLIFISVSNNFILICLPTFLLVWYHILCYIILLLLQWEVKSNETKTIKDFFFLEFFESCLLLKEDLFYKSKHQSLTSQYLLLTLIRIFSTCVCQLMTQ